MKAKIAIYLTFSFITLHSPIFSMEFKSAMHLYNDANEAEILLSSSDFDHLTREQKEKLLEKFVQNSREARVRRNMQPNF